MRYVRQPMKGSTMRKNVQAALPKPDISWSRKRSVRIEMNIEIHATRTMNQKIETKTFHRDIPGSFGQERLAGVCRSQISILAGAAAVLIRRVSTADRCLPGTPTRAAASGM